MTIKERIEAADSLKSLTPFNQKGVRAGNRANFTLGKKIELRGRVISTSACKYLMMPEFRPLSTAKAINRLE